MKTRIAVETQSIKLNKNFNNKFDRNKSKNNKIEKNIFKNVDATKNKNDRKSKFFRKRKHDDEKNYFELICFICHKSKHITSNCSNKKNNNKKFKIVVVATKKKQIFDEFDSIDENKRKLKIEKIIKMKKKISQNVSKKTTFILLNDDVKINLIDQIFVVSMKFIMIFNDFSIVDFFNEIKSYCYETYEIILIFQNF